MAQPDCISWHLDDFLSLGAGWFVCSPSHLESFTQLPILPTRVDIGHAPWGCALREGWRQREVMWRESNERKERNCVALERRVAFESNLPNHYKNLVEKTLDRKGAVCTFKVWKNREEISIIQGAHRVWVLSRKKFLNDSSEI